MKPPQTNPLLSVRLSACGSFLHPGREGPSVCPLIEGTLLHHALIKPPPPPICYGDKTAVRGEERLADALKSWCQLHWWLNCYMCTICVKATCGLVFVCAYSNLYALWCVVSNKQTDGVHSTHWMCQHRTFNQRRRDRADVFVYDILYMRVGNACDEGV